MRKGGISTEYNATESTFKLGIFSREMEHYCLEIGCNPRRCPIITLRLATLCNTDHGTFVLVGEIRK